jgi:biopolymer transport protein ExbB/TolQ
MQQMFPQVEPPSKFTIFMEKFAWPTITLIVGTVLAAVIIAIWLGKIQIVDFSWIMLIAAFVMLVITVSFAWYSVRTRKKLQEQYDEDRAALYTDYRQFKENWRNFFDNEKFRWDDFAVNFTRKNMEEQNKRHEELKKQCMDAIADAENRMDSSIKNVQTIFTGAVESQRRAVDTYGEQLIHAQKQMNELEQRLRKELSLPDEENITPP